MKGHVAFLLWNIKGPSFHVLIHKKLLHVRLQERLERPGIAMTRVAVNGNSRRGINTDNFAPVCTGKESLQRLVEAVV